MALFARLGVGSSTVLTWFVGPHLPPLLLLPAPVKVTFGLRTPSRPLPSVEAWEGPEKKEEKQ